MAAALERVSERLPAMVIETLREQWAGVAELDAEIDTIERRIAVWHRQNVASRRSAAFPGVRVLTATAAVATMGDPATFRSGREFAAWLGLVPRHTGTRGRVRMLGISKRGDTYLRTLLIHGACSALAHGKAPSEWQFRLAERRPGNGVSTAHHQALQMLTNVRRVDKGSFHIRLAGSRSVPARIIGHPRQEQMEQRIARGVLIAGIVVASFALASPVAAQSGDWMPSAFLNINGTYPLDDATEHSTTLGGVSLYGETAEYRVGYQPQRKTFVDGQLGIRVWNRLALGVGVSFSENGNSATVSGSAPNPLFYNRPRDVSPLTVDLKQEQLAVHVQAFYFVPITSWLDIAFFAGPSFLQLSRASVEGVTLGPESDSPLFNAATLADVATASDRSSAIGANVGIDISVMFTRVVGIGIFAKYVTGSVDIGGESIKVGGAEAGGGLRLRF